jgi:hypothetical protein
MGVPSARQLAELEAAAKVLRAAASRRSSAQYIPHRPHPKQAEFLALDTREALYGGAAGGGKSDALLMAALRYVHVPGYTALLLRRTFADLAQPGAIMERARSWLAGTGADWNEQRKQFRFPSSAILQFGYMETANDRYRYQGTEYQFVGWDEVTQFPEQPYQYMFSRLRKLAGVDIPLRVRAATNPGGIGHEWVRRRFIDPGSPERPFVPALIDDNPSLDAESYRASLAQLDAATRAQLEHGVWVRDAEGLVYHYDEGRNAVTEAPVCPSKVLALDFGATAPTSFTILGWRPNDPTVYILRSWKVPGMAPSDAASEIARLEAEHSFEGIVGDIGGLGKGYQLEQQRRYHVPMEPAEKANKLGYIALFNGDLEKGLVKVVRGACEPLTKEWAELPWHESRSKEMGGFDNHCADGALYGWRKCMAFVERPKQPPPSLEEVRAREEQALIDAAEAEAQRQASEQWWG